MHKRPIFLTQSVEARSRARSSSASVRAVSCAAGRRGVLTAPPDGFGLIHFPAGRGRLRVAGGPWIEVEAPGCCLVDGGMTVEWEFPRIQAAEVRHLTAGGRGLRSLLRVNGGSQLPFGAYCALADAFGFGRTFDLLLDDFRSGRQLLVLARLLHLLSKTDRPGSRDESHDGARSRLRDFLGLLREEPQRVWREQEVARFCGVSTSRLRLLFRLETGTSLRQFEIGAKLECVAKALQGGRARVADLADEFFNGNQSYLSRAFRRRFGCPPSAYRKRHRSGVGDAESGQGTDG